MAADLGHQRADPVVVPGAAQAVDDVGQPELAQGHHRGQRVRGRPLGDAVGEIELEDQRRRVALP